MIVVDTSAVIGALVGRPADAGLVERIAGAGELHAPHLIDVEFLHALRRLVVSGGIGDHRAEDARRDFADLQVVRYPHVPLLDRMWELRHNLTSYDAAFVVLAEALEVPLVTCDGRLARSSGHRARIELMGG
jgi:predicted nucleic acid-binding protein